MRQLGVVIAAGALMMSCSEHVQGVGDFVAPQEQPVRASATDRARQTLGAYFEALNALDVDAAMRHRCEESRVDPDDQDLFREQVRQLIDQIGTLALGDVQVATESNRVSYTIKGHDGRSTVEVRSEQGNDVLCGWRPAPSVALAERLDGEVVDLGPFDGDVGDLLPQSVGESFQLVGEPPEHPSSRSNATTTHSRAWKAEGFGGVTVTVHTYAEDRWALDDASQFIATAASDGVERLHVSDTPDVVAVRYLGYAWLWAQPPSTPPFIDLAVLPFGRTLVTIGVSGLEPSIQHTVLNGLVADVLRRAEH